MPNLFRLVSYKSMTQKAPILGTRGVEVVIDYQKDKIFNFLKISDIIIYNDFREQSTSVYSTLGTGALMYSMFA